MSKKDKTDLFSQTYTVKGDGVAVLSPRKLKDVRSFTSSLEAMRRKRIVEKRDITSTSE